MNAILNYFRQKMFNRLKKKLSKLIQTAETHITDEILEIIMKAMGLALRIDPSFRENIKGFNAKYIFRTERSKIDVSAIFSNNKMKVKDRAIKDEDINCEVVFKDGNAIRAFLFSGKPDVLAFMLNNQLRYEGNLNYLLKFAYMAKHLQLQLGV